MSKQTAVRLSDETFNRLQSLSQRTGRTATYYIREAIQAHLDDLEDVYSAELAIERLKQGHDTILSSDEFWHGVDN